MNQYIREQIVVTVTRDGVITAETRGIKGAACLDYIEVLEDLLAAQTTSSAFTDDYLQTTTERDDASNELEQR